MEQALRKFLEILVAAAFIVAGFAANSVCAFIMYQPEMPKDYKSLRKF